MEITQELLHDMFDYKEGNLYWKVNRRGKAHKGTKAGWKRTDGYCCVEINSQPFQVHRLIFLFHHGYIPKYIDHINGIRSDNKIENLRGATEFENAQNSRIRSDNTSGFKGVYFDKRRNRWQVRITTQGKTKYIGSYTTKEEASLVSQKVRKEYHGEFARHE